jgi:hypothetical protein
MVGHLLKGIKNLPLNSDYHFKLGFLYLELAQKDKAESEFELSRELTQKRLMGLK